MPKGSKTCSNCGKDTGPRTKICECGTAFTFKDKTSAKLMVVDTAATKVDCITEKVKEYEGIALKTSKNLVFIPGKHSCSKKDFCPIKLQSSEAALVLDWLDEMQCYTFQHCERLASYSRSAIKYFAETFIPRYIGINKNPEFEKVITLIEENMPPYQEELLHGYS
jgi:hypothetical protein